MVLPMIRLLFIMLFILAGFLLARDQQFLEPTDSLLLGSALAGLFLGVLILLSERKLKKVLLPRLMWSLVGLLTGAVLAGLLIEFFSFIPVLSSLRSSLFFMAALLFGYIGLMLGYLNYDRLSIHNLLRVMRGSQVEKNFKILDTSVIIDGRIADICETGFVDGTLIIPQFVLKELQHIADSSDVLKRNRGRRGLDILQKIQKLSDVKVDIMEMDFPKIREVDAKLVELGKAIGGKILTNDFNLNKIAELQGVHVLNVNELANALKPVVLPGELMHVHVLKEGKESGQGVAYLDDGTMVVVDNAVNAIGKDVEVSVTSVLQTTAGRMIFSKLKEVINV